MADREHGVLVTGGRAPVALHLARLLATAGWRTVVADTFARPLCAHSALAPYRRLPPPADDAHAYGEAVRALATAEEIGTIVPTCEEVLHLGALAGADGRIGPAALLAPPMERLIEAHDKHAFIRLAERIGLAVPATTLLLSRDDVDAMRGDARRLAFKPVWSRFATRVLLRPSPAGLALVAPTVTDPWVAQEFVEGEEISAYAVARRGRPTALALYRSLYRAGHGAGVCFERIAEADASEVVARFIAATGWHGQVSFDLIRRADGTVLPIECNPRATSGLNLFRDPAPFAAALLGDPDDAVLAPDVGQPQTVPLALWLYGLPRALREGRPGRFLATARRARNLLDWPGDPEPKRRQIGVLGEIAGVALRRRIGLQAASTRDIEWNGPGAAG